MEDVNLTGLGDAAVPEIDAGVIAENLAGPPLRTRTLLGHPD